MPPPHSLEHLPQADQCDSPHSTGHGICLHFRCVVSAGQATPRLVLITMTSRAKLWTPP